MQLLKIFFSVIFISASHISGADTIIPLQPSMLSLAPGSSGNPALLIDEQTLVGDPLAGTLSDPQTNWQPTDGGHLNSAILNLGEDYDLSHIAFYDRNGSAVFRVYDDVTNTLLLSDDLLAYKVWKFVALAQTTSRLRIENSTGFGRVPEIVLYGQKSLVPDAAAVLPEFKVTHHTTALHHQYQCSSDCDYLFNPGNIPYELSPAKGIQPGKHICLRGGTYTKPFLLKNLLATEQQPTRVSNCEGQVIFDNVTEPIRANQSVHFKILGNGDASVLYGFKINNSINAGAKIRYLSRDFELGWIHFTNSQGVAIKAKSELIGTDPVTDTPFVQTGTHIHHTRSEFTLQHEAFYIGNTGCEPNKPFPDAPLVDVFIHDNILLDSGADALQVGCASGDVQVNNNYINKAGYRPFQNDTRQRHGIQIGKSSSGKVFNNWVEDSPIDCIHAEGGHPAGIQMYNNILLNCARAVYFNARLSYAQQVVFAHNTLINMRNDAFRAGMGHKNSATLFSIYNNLVIGEAENTALFFDGDAQPGPLSGLNFLDAYGQVFLDDVSDGLFIDAAAGDYRLFSLSPAVNSDDGSHNSSITVDLRNLPRDDQADAGALEFFRP